MQSILRKLFCFQCFLEMLLYCYIYPKIGFKSGICLYVILSNIVLNLNVDVIVIFYGFNIVKLHDIYI